ncbi:MAG: flagellar hook-length control protein FliK, partial [Lachnospiraceae bacterium]|nr:flagellar hook-length control protein FliK [Lachnospiraceae bacterium]
GEEQENSVITVNEVTQENASMEQPEQESENMDFQTGKDEARQDKRQVQTGEHAAFTVNHEVNPAEVEAPQPAAYTAPDVDVDSIMRQISEFARVNFTQENTTLEMQLNPQNLGRLYLHISTTGEGNVTARIAATDETVKQLLEVQLADLRTSLNQQGIKVDAIEVTVASHEFERNLEQNAAGQQQQAEQQERERSQGSRRIFRGELDELSGLMSEEEVLAARIMKDHGNTMDVTA